jgi:hypothetical protein
VNEATTPSTHLQALLEFSAAALRMLDSQYRDVRSWSDRALFIDLQTQRNLGRTRPVTALQMLIGARADDLRTRAEPGSADAARVRVLDTVRDSLRRDEGVVAWDEIERRAGVRER